MLRRLVAMVCVLVACVSLASPAAGHVAIRVLITFPQPGERVGPHTELRVYAQPFLGGVDATTFTVELDGRPLNAVGRLMRVATPSPSGSKRRKGSRSMICPRAITRSP